VINYSFGTMLSHGFNAYIKENVACEIPGAAVDALSSGRVMNYVLGETPNRSSSGASLPRSRLIGVFLVRPNSDCARQIFEDMNYFNKLSGAFIDLFYAGVISRSSMSVISQEKDLHAAWSLGGRQYVFDEKVFAYDVKWLEGLTGIKYGHGNELVIFSVKTTLHGEVVKATESVIKLDFDALLADRVINNPSSFLGQISRFAEKHRLHADPVYAISDAFGLAELGVAFEDTVLGLVPDQAKSLYKRGRHFALR